MSFTEEQTKALSAKLNAKYIKTRDADGMVLSYVEGWHVIAEANRVFGFDSWDRQTVMSKCIWEEAKDRNSACSYIARVRVRVHAGDAIICREGSGSGHGRGKTLGEAHESALKEAETDAMKRALSTFGNPFGLALYDKEQKGVRPQRQSIEQRQIFWAVYDETGERGDEYGDPAAYCSAARKYLEGITEVEKLMSFWKWNRDTVAELREHMPDLKSPKGQHYAEILSNLYTLRLQEFVLRRSRAESAEPATDVPKIDEKNSSDVKPVTVKNSEHISSVEPSSTGLPTKISETDIQQHPKRIRDKSHLRYIASLNCLVCGRSPSQAHHVTFAQPNAMSRKVSDEWTVPLCVFHHRELHDAGNEKEWWETKKLDPISKAEQNWTFTRIKLKAS